MVFSAILHSLPFRAQLVFLFIDAGRCPTLGYFALSELFIVNFADIPTKKQINVSFFKNFFVYLPAK